MSHPVLGKVAVCLGGGGSAGINTVGHLLAVQEIEYDWLHGTSVGSLCGAMYHAGQLDALREIWLTVQSDDVYVNNLGTAVQVVLGSNHVYDSRPLLKLLQSSINVEKVKADPRPFNIMTTDYFARTAFMQRASESFDLPRLCYASASPPMLFTPVRYGDRTLVDGGMSSNFCLVDAVSDGADTVILLRPRRYGSPHDKHLTDIAGWYVGSQASLMLDREVMFTKIMNKYKRHIRIIDVVPKEVTLTGILDFNLGSRSTRQAIIDQQYAEAKAIIQAAIAAAT